MILAITAGFASAQSEEGNSHRSEDKKEASVSASERARYCSKDMKGNSHKAERTICKKVKALKGYDSLQSFHTIGSILCLATRFAIL